MRTDNPVVCRVCGNQEGNRVFQAREMMFGSREVFDYLQCGDCGTIQILNVPEDLSRHYPPSYYSFSLPRLKQNRVRTYLRRQRARHYLGIPTILGRLAAHPEAKRPLIFHFLSLVNANQDTPILDVGCGSGSLLAELWKYGFRDLTGIDPFLPEDIHFNPSFRVLRRQLEEETRLYSIVMMHHSFEHMANPLSAFQKAAALLSETGTLLIRIPLANSFCSRHYGRDWVQLDAPRHLFLHTERSIEILTSAVGLKIKKIIYDSETFQFWGSEQIKQDIPILDPRSYGIDPERSIFTTKDIQAFALEAEQLNKKGEGDQACFILGH